MGNPARALVRGEVRVGDGAWGTQLLERGFAAGECLEELNLAHPETLIEIARSYLTAGAELLTTNTFGGCARKLRAFGLERRTEAINRSGARLLCEVAAGQALVLGSVGPSGALLEPYGDADERELRLLFEQQIRALAEGGADVICIETMTDLREAALALEAARAVAPALPRIATMTFDPTPRGYFTVMGIEAAQAARGLADAGADLVGSNCGRGSAEMLEIARRMLGATRCPVVIQPNAGLPERRDGRVVYPETPQQMAQRATELLDLGVRVVGGCCGTTPEHIRAIRERVDRWRSSRRDSAGSRGTGEESEAT